MLAKPFQIVTGNCKHVPRKQDMTFSLDFWRKCQIAKRTTYSCLQRIELRQL